MPRIDWSRHVPLYRHPNGTVWVRFLRGDMNEELKVSTRLLGYASGFTGHPDPWIVLYDPDLDRAVERHKNAKEDASALSDDKGSRGVWSRSRVALPIPEEDPGEWHLLNIFLYVRTPDLIQILPSDRTDLFSAERSAPFLRWAFPRAHLSSRPNPDPVAVSRVYEDIVPRSYRQTLQGTPLLDLSTYRLLGLDSPIALPDDAFRAWWKASSA